MTGELFKSFIINIRANYNNFINTFKPWNTLWETLGQTIGLTQNEISYVFTDDIITPSSGGHCKKISRSGNGPMDQNYCIIFPDVSVISTVYDPGVK